MITPIFYFTNNDAGNLAYYREICSAVDLPVIIYNVIAQNPISPELMERLSEIQGMYGIKQSVGGLHSLARMLLRCADKTKVFGAQDDLAYLSFAMGAVGSISAIHSVFPRESVQIWDYVKAGSIEKARLLQDKLLAVMQVMEKYPFPSGVSAAITAQGRDCGVPRRPIMPVGDDGISEFRRLMERLELI